jgi:putative toxin-antitoxin system antitoxin component (TIGR02293 family)
MCQLRFLFTHMKQRPKRVSKVPQAKGYPAPEKTSAPHPSASLASTHYEILDGYGASAVGEAAESYGVSVAEMAKRIGVSRSTLHRKLAAKGRLTEHESDALARYSALLVHATQVFDEDVRAARSWLMTPQIGLGGAVPIDFAKTTVGYQEVENLLVRIDYGVYA